ncbi:MAG: fibrobacter succinogenes major paralogous domain-containing protein, partial [Flavobacteriales bacterium]|nr:fibrobacter succinogenes major paralogous domain-containing protein [Flavobacteriales bacterium]
VSLDTTVNVELLKKSIPVVYIVPIGLGAIPIYVEYKVNVDAEAKLKLTDVISMRDTVRTTMSCDLGLVYDGQAHSYNNSTGTFYAGGEVTQFSPSLGIKVAFKEKVTASLFGLLGPFLSLSIPEASARGTIALPSLDFDASVKASVKLETGIDLTTISGATTVLGGGLWESDSLFWRTPNKVEIVFGNDQVGQPDSTLTDSLAVKVTSTLGAPQKNVHVHFEVTAGGGSLSQQVVDTDAEGVARCTWTLGPETLPDQRVKAWARFGNGDTLVGGPLLFKAEFAELQAEVYAGDDQVAHLSDPLPAPIMVRVVDQDDVPYAGIMVHFEIASGGGELTVDSVITDADGLAGSDWTLGSNELDQQLVHAWATTSQHDTLPPGILTFNAHFPYNIMDYADVHDFDGDVGDDMPPMRVYVGDQLGLPQFNIPVHFTVVSGSGGSLSQTLVHTDAQGIATCNWNLGAFTAHTQVVKAWSLDQDGDTLLGGPLYFTATEPGVCTVLGSFPGMANYGEVLQINVLATGIYTGTPLQGIGAGLTTWRGADIPNPPGGGTTGPDGIAVVGWQMVAYNTGGQHAKLVCLGDTTLFSTSLPNCTGTVEDVDGNEYPIGWVGCHCAMLKNLRTTHFTNGDSIPFGTNAEWDGADTTFQALADHVNSDEANDDQYGLLYNFEAAITQNSIRQLCPDGWGIPDAYFANVAGGMNEVITSLGGPSIAGGKLKATTLWDPPNFGASNSTGFSAYPAGSRTPGGPQDMGIFGRFWTHQATLFGNAYFLQLSTYSEAVQTQYTSRKNGLSCRCWNNYKRDME